MDGRDGMALTGFSNYYIHGSGPDSGNIAYTTPEFHVQHGFRSLSNPSNSVQSNTRDNSSSSLGSAFPVENKPSVVPPHGLSIVPSGVPIGESAKKKKGRPRKYGPDGTNMSLGLSPLSSKPRSESTPKRARGRPKGSGWKQQLAPLGEWMNRSAGLAFAPHVMNVRIGEDIASKILSFAQQRPRAVCVLSASGSVSAVKLRQPAPFDRPVTYEGHFQLLCLSGSYLVADSGGPRSRTGGLSVSFCRPDGHILGGVVDGLLIAGTPVQVVLCSFVYSGSKPKDKAETTPTVEPKSAPQLGEKPATPLSIGSGQNHSQAHSASAWSNQRPDLRNQSRTGIDLTSG